MTKEEAEIFGTQVKQARQARGWSQERLAKEANVTQSTIARVELGDSLRSGSLPAIAAALDLTLQVNGRRPRIVLPDAPGQNYGDLPLFAAVEGGPGQVIVDRDPQGSVSRPDFLRGIGRAYAVTIDGDSMHPEYRRGDQALVHPRLPPVPNEVYIFYTDNPADDRATIKHLVRSTADAWHVEQWNPPKKFTLSKQEWPKCHRVVGKYARR